MNTDKTKFFLIRVYPCSSVAIPDFFPAFLGRGFPQEHNITRSKTSDGANALGTDGSVRAATGDTMIDREIVPA